MASAIRRRNFKTVAVVGQRALPPEVGARVIVEASERFRQNRARERLERRASHIPERASVERAMLAVEDRIVRAFWVLARLPNDKGIGYASRNGIDYTPEAQDRWDIAVANGKWEQPPPRPAIPSAKAIDAMHEPFDWLRWLDRASARLVAVVAQTKRGQTAANVSWGRVRRTLPELGEYSANRLHRMYRAGLRSIVNELTLARAQRMH